MFSRLLSVSKKPAVEAHAERLPLLAMMAQLRDDVRDGPGERAWRVLLLIGPLCGITGGIVLALQ